MNTRSAGGEDKQPNASAEASARGGWGGGDTSQRLPEEAAEGAGWCRGVSRRDEPWSQHSEEQAQVETPHIFKLFFLLVHNSFLLTIEIRAFNAWKSVYLSFEYYSAWKTGISCLVGAGFLEFKLFQGLNVSIPWFSWFNCNHHLKIYIYIYMYMHVSSVFPICV